MNVWRLITHHEDKDAALFWTRQNSRIAIGWGAIRDIRIRGYNSADVIVRRDLSPEDIWKKPGDKEKRVPSGTKGELPCILLLVV